MQTSEYNELKTESTQRLSDLINGMASIMNQRYYTLDLYATELLEALDSGDSEKIAEAKAKLRQYLKLGF